MPARVVSPATSKRSLIATILPSIGDSRCPKRGARVGGVGCSLRFFGIDAGKRARTFADRVGDRRERPFEPLATFRLLYHVPVFAIETQGSAGGFAAPFCSNSIEMPSGERTNAILPSRGGRLMTTPAFIKRSQSA